MRDTFSGRHKLITVEVPVTLCPLDRTTAENEVAAVELTAKRIPHLESFLSTFPLQTRLVCADRYSANLKAEKYLAASKTSRLSVVLGCTLHKIATCMKRALAPFEGAISGVIHTGLSLEGGGSLCHLRHLLRQVLEQELCIEFTAAPTGFAAEYANEVLNLFCPVHEGAHARTVHLRRRFVLRYFLNGDWTSPVISHYCVFGCCSSSQETRAHVAQWVTWALLPRKCGVFSRKSWTGGDLPVE